MNKDERLYMHEVFIPKLEKLGYNIVQKSKELYRFCYNEQIFFNIFLHKDFLQGICIFNVNEKQIFSIRNLYLLDVNPIYLERLKDVGDCFYFDNKTQFIGILNCFYDLLKRNTENLINEGVEKLMKKIVQKNSLCREQGRETSQKEYLLKEVERKIKLQNSIRFTEDDLLIQTD